MFTFDRKRRSSLTQSPVPEPASRRSVTTPPVNPLWLQLATSSNAGAVARMTELRNEVESRLDLIGPVDIGGLIGLITKATRHQRRQLYLERDTRAMVIGRLGGHEAEEVLAAMLAGTPYYPGIESKAYQSMSASEQAPINKEANRRFTAETGITRKLMVEERDKVLARRWLELRDDVIRDQQADILKQAEMDASYNEHLRDAVEVLKQNRFGSATELGGTTYDLNYWEKVKDEEFKGYGKLVTKVGVEPAEAVKELFDEKKLKKWAFDCAEFIQVAHLYARWKTMGSEAFNVSAGSRLELRIHYSTGVSPELGYERHGPTEKMIRVGPDGNIPVDTPVDDLLDEVPVGSRVTWRNLLADPNTDFYNENTMKVGNDQFAAQGLTGDNGKIFSRADLERALARITYGKHYSGEPPASYIKQNVFLKAIEHYKRPTVEHERK
jgi:hypothetical protein